MKGKVEEQGGRVGLKSRWKGRVGGKGRRVGWEGRVEE